jgi:hemolysin III
MKNTVLNVMFGFAYDSLTSLEDNRCMLRRAREPINTITHSLGVPMAVAFTIILIWLAARSNLTWWPFAVFGASMLLVYAASSLYHGLHVPARVLEGLRRFDHSAIFISIAGTYTPVAWLCLPEPWRTGTLVVVWGYALLGVILKSTWRMPEWFSVMLYLLMGWLAVGLLPQLVQVMPTGSLTALVIGGLCYSVGVIFYASRRLRLGSWGHHELWHLFVLGGSISHFAMVAQLIRA